jgi:hypothetical protein
VHPAHLRYSLDRIQAVDREAPINEDDEGVPGTQGHRVALGELDEGVIVAVKTNLAACQMWKKANSVREHTLKKTRGRNGSPRRDCDCAVA